MPNIVSLNPRSTTSGAAAFSLTVTGADFVSSSTVQWNGTSRQTTFASSTQLQAQISASDIANSGTALVSVINPAPGGGSSGSAEFIVNATSNLVPTLSSLSPTSITEGTGTFLLTLNGSDFVPASTIQWNGTTIAGTYLSENQLEVEIPAADVANLGFADVTVTNPNPGGGESSALTFSITYGPTVVSQAANDIVWDSAHQLIYLSVPSLAATNGNSITAIDPLTGNIQLTQYAGSEPGVLAISEDDQFLYAGVEGSSSVQRFTLPGLTPDISYLLGADPAFGPYAAYDLQVAPNSAHTTAVSRGLSNLSSAIGGMAIYDDATERSKTAYYPGDFYDSIQWGSDTALYANNGEVSSFDFYKLAVNGNGVVQTADYQNIFSNFYISIHYDTGTKLIYGDDGTIVNPANGQNVGNFQASGLMVPDSTLNSAFFLGQTQSQFGTTNYTMESFDLATLAPTAEIVISGVQGFPLRLIRWGTNGLAFNDNAGYVFILNNPFVTADGKKVITPKRFLSPIKRVGAFSRANRSPKGFVEKQTPRPRIDRTNGATPLDNNPPPSLIAVTPNVVEAGVDEFTLTVTGSNFLSYSTIQWNGSVIPTEYVSSSELQAQVSASYVASPVTADISVLNPSPGGGASNNLYFTAISASSNPTPVIISLYPDSIPAGSAGLTVDINGLTYFNASSVVLWNGVPRLASLYTTGELQVQVNPADIATPGYAEVSVYNPGPGGGMSNTAEFQILYQPLVVQQVTNDLVWDPKNQVIYISTPSSAPTHPNQICVLNPTTGSISNCQPGNEPGVIAISDDSQFLYVGMDGSNSVQRFTLPDLAPDISYPLPSDSNGGPYYALDLQVAPGAPHTTAVSKGTVTDPRATGGIVIYDDDTPRPVSAQGWGPTSNSYDSIQWGADATKLYAANESTTEFDFYTLDVSSSGVVLNTDYPELWWNPGRIHFDSGSGLIYSDDGYHAVNPATGLPAGLFEVGGGWPMAPDSGLNTVFILSQYVWQDYSHYTVDLFDMTHYLPVTMIPFSTSQDGIMSLGRFIRWGTNGLALNDTQGDIYIISAPFVNGSQSRSRNKRHFTPTERRGDDFTTNTITTTFRSTTNIEKSK